MDASLGRIKAHLAGPSVGRIGELVGLINSNVDPPSPVVESDVYIRAMYIVSDEVNSFGGRFPTEELQHLTGLLIDSPVMVGHRKDRLPVARTFHAKLVERDGKEWVKSYFYWLRSANGAADLKENIDGGIYKECSIGFTYLFPECSVCGKDIRSCRHEPMGEYAENGEAKKCHFNYRQVERVLESSLVYRGAVPDTAMSKDLVTETIETENEKSDAEPVKIESPAELSLDATYIVMPNYESVPVVVRSEDEQVRLFDRDDQPIDQAVVDSLKLDEKEFTESCHGFLVGYRGKARCDVRQLRKHLNGQRSPVTRVELKLLPLPGGDTDSSFIRHEYCTVATLEGCARRLMTRHGVMVWCANALWPQHAGYLYHPSKDSRLYSGYYRVLMIDGKGDAVFEFCHDEKTARYVVRQFNVVRFNRGCRFIADVVDGDNESIKVASGVVISGGVTQAAKVDDGLVLAVEGALEGGVAIAPVKINGRRRLLIYRTLDQHNPMEKIERDV